MSVLPCTGKWTVACRRTSAMIIGLEASRLRQLESDIQCNWLLPTTFPIPLFYHVYYYYFFFFFVSAKCAHDGVLNLKIISRTLKCFSNETYIQDSKERIFDCRRILISCESLFVCPSANWGVSIKFPHKSDPKTRCIIFHKLTYKRASKLSTTEFVKYLVLQR